MGKSIYEYIMDADYAACEGCCEPISRDDVECAFCGREVEEVC